MLDWKLIFIFANLKQELRMIQNKLKSIEDTICWINQEEALFKFPQSSYPDVGDVNVRLKFKAKQIKIGRINWYSVILN